LAHGTSAAGDGLREGPGAQKAFYRDALQRKELPELAQDGWVEFDAGGARMALHKIPAQYAEGIVIERPPRVRDGAATKLMFEVEDLARAIARLQQHGAFMREPWDFGACDGVDPEGNFVQVVQKQTG
jgi:predicted enzyme related to lactoylglutathione lyase